LANDNSVIVSKNRILNVTAAAREKYSTAAWLVSRRLRRHGNSTR